MPMTWMESDEIVIDYILAELKEAKFDVVKNESYLQIKYDSYKRYVFFPEDASVSEHREELVDKLVYLIIIDDKIFISRDALFVTVVANKRIHHLLFGKSAQMDRFGIWLGDEEFMPKIITTLQEMIKHDS